MLAAKKPIKIIPSWYTNQMMYAVAIPLAFVQAGLACALYVAVAIMWLIPDRRIEKAIAKNSRE